MSIYHNFKFTFEIQKSTTFQPPATIYIQPCGNLLTTCVDSRTHRIGGVYEISQIASIHHLHAIQCEVKFLSQYCHFPNYGQFHLSHGHKEDHTKCP